MSYSMRIQSISIQFEGSTFLIQQTELNKKENDENNKELILNINKIFRENLNYNPQAQDPYYHLKKDALYAFLKKKLYDLSLLNSLSTELIEKIMLSTGEGLKNFSNTCKRFQKIYTAPSFRNQVEKAIVKEFKNLNEKIELSFLEINTKFSSRVEIEAFLKSSSLKKYPNFFYFLLTKFESLPSSEKNLLFCQLITVNTDEQIPLVIPIVEGRVIEALFQRLNPEELIPVLTTHLGDLSLAECLIPDRCREAKNFALYITKEILKLGSPQREVLFSRLLYSKAFSPSLPDCEFFIVFFKGLDLKKLSEHLKLDSYTNIFKFLSKIRATSWLECWNFILEKFSELPSAERTAGLIEALNQPTHALFQRTYDFRYTTILDDLFERVDQRDLSTQLKTDQSTEFLKYSENTYLQENEKILKFLMEIQRN